jgi:RimJ/RimL family protein N-acetyltransferase
MVEEHPDLLGPSLFQGERVYLTIPDPDKDAEIEAKWTQDPEYTRLVRDDPPRPLSPAQVKKQYEKEKDEKSTYVYTIRLREDDRLIGFTRLEWVEWSHGNAKFSFQIGDPKDRGHGYGSEALNLILRYAFMELNLFRLTAWLLEYNVIGIEFLHRVGFQEEVRQRQALHRYNRRWDLIIMGLMREDWEKTMKEGASPV